jgi:hypothetical protein
LSHPGEGNSSGPQSLYHKHFAPKLQENGATIITGNSALLASRRTAPFFRAAKPSSWVAVLRD